MISDAAIDPVDRVLDLSQEHLSSDLALTTT